MDQKEYIYNFKVVCITCTCKLFHKGLCIQVVHVTLKLSEKRITEISFYQKRNTEVMSGECPLCSYSTCDRNLVSPVDPSARRAPLFPPISSRPTPHCHVGLQAIDNRRTAPHHTETKQRMKMSLSRIGSV